MILIAWFLIMGQQHQRNPRPFYTKTKCEEVQQIAIKNGAIGSYCIEEEYLKQ